MPKFWIEYWELVAVLHTREPELKELVSLSDTANGGSLSKDEITIIRGALDLSEKLVVDVMTDLKNVYMIDVKSKLDRKLLTEEILKRGHSRVPVYENHRDNIIGVLLVKSLVLLDPDDSVPVKDVKILPIPSVTPDISLYDILNTFQRGGNHMAIVVDERNGSRPGSNGCASVAPSAISAPYQHNGSPSSLAARSQPRRQGRYRRSAAKVSINNNASTSKTDNLLGVITLEDVIEELIQQEIIDETDVFVDIRNRIKVVRAVSRAHPAETTLRTGGRLLASTDSPSTQPNQLSPKYPVSHCRRTLYFHHLYLHQAEKVSPRMS